jgi:ribonuclease HI
VSFDPHSLKIYVDGNCWKNPGGQGGFAARVEYPFDWNREDESVDYRGFFETNNNRMELRACIFAHEWAFDNIDELAVQRIQVFTDSTYVSDGYGWVLRWSQSDYCNSDGRPIKNDDLWKDLMRLRRKLAPRIRVEVKLIPGKSTPATKLVDKEAKAAGLAPTETDWGFPKGKIGRSKNKTGKAASLYPAAGQELIVRIYHSGMARRGLQVFKFQVYDDVRKDFFDKFEAYADSSVGDQLHRQNVYRVRMNAVPRFPKILEILAQLQESELVPAEVGRP